MPNKIVDKHTRIILDRYSGDQSFGVPSVDEDILMNTYLGKVLDFSELEGRTLLEIGAGCSQYAPLFLKSGLKKYIANDLIEDRLVMSRTSDERHDEILGDFLDISLNENVDFIFASLTMMFVVPKFNEFIDKIDGFLEAGGVFISFDPNYLCPLSIYRRFSDTKNNPSRLFNPFNYSNLFKEKGYVLEQLIPFSGPYPKLGNSWLTGTSFCMRVRKL